MDRALSTPSTSTTTATTPPIDRPPFRHSSLASAQKADAGCFLISLLHFSFQDRTRGPAVSKLQDGPFPGLDPTSKPKLPVCMPYLLPPQFPCIPVENSPYDLFNIELLGSNSRGQKPCHTSSSMFCVACAHRRPVASTPSRKATPRPFQHRHSRHDRSGW